jgi:hypothetical protein
MKKTILAIAIAAASTVAFATGGESTAVNTYSSAAVGGSVGSAVVGNGGGLAIMGSNASAWNYSAASADSGADKCAPGVATETSALTIGGASSTSAGLVIGNAGGYNMGNAYTTGSASAKASDYGHNEGVWVDSAAKMAAGAGTVVYGTGLSTQHSVAGAFNKSSAEANGYDGLTVWGFPGVAGGSLTAGSVGGSFSGSAGLTVGNAIGGTGAIAGQDGSAGGYAGGTVYKPGSAPVSVGSAGVSGGVDTGSVSSTLVAGTGLAGTGALSGGLVGGNATLITNGTSIAASSVPVYDIKGAATIGGNIGNAADLSYAGTDVGISGSAGTY